MSTVKLAHYTIGSKCHERSVAVTEFYSINLPRTEVLIAYCLPRKPLLDRPQFI